MAGHRHTAGAVALALLAANPSLDPARSRLHRSNPGRVADSAALALPVAVRRRWPLPVLGWLVLAAAAATAFGVVGAGVIWVLYAPVALALYTATAVGTAAATVALAGSLAAPAATATYKIDLQIRVVGAVEESMTPGEGAYPAEAASQLDSYAQIDRV